MLSKPKSQNPKYEKGDLVRVGYDQRTAWMGTYWYRSCKGREVVVQPGPAAGEYYPVFCNPDEVHKEHSPVTASERASSMPEWAR